MRETIRTADETTTVLPRRDVSDSARDQSTARFGTQLSSYPQGLGGGGLVVGTQTVS